MGDETIIKDTPKRGRKPAAPKGGAFKAVHAPLANPLTGVRFETIRPTEVLEIDGWLQAQLDAGLIVKM